MQQTKFKEDETEDTEIEVLGDLSKPKARAEDTDFDLVLN